MRRLPLGLVGVPLVAFALSSAAAPARPFPQHVVQPGQLHAPSLHGATAQDDHVRASYTVWRQHYLVQAGTDPDGHTRWRVRMGRSADDPTTSEAQAWGMLIAVWMAGHEPDAQAIFDGLWRFALDHPSTIDARLMDFWVDADESPDPFGDDSAFDGDMDMALALLLAAEQWGSGPRFDYAGAALTLLEGLRAAALGPDSHLPLLGDWVDPDGALYSQYTPRSSDLSPAHFRVFARETGHPDWSAAVAASQTLIEASQLAWAPDTGLLPDFFQPVTPGSLPLRPADPLFLESPADGAWSYNATRVALRLGSDALWWDDPLSALQVRRLSLWFEAETGGLPAALRAGYALDGSPLVGSDYFTTAFAAPLLVAAAVTPGQQAWLDALYEPVRTSDEDYYEDTLSLLSLLVVTGNAWGPAAAAPAPVPLLPRGLAAALALALCCAALRRNRGRIGPR